MAPVPARKNTANQMLPQSFLITCTHSKSHRDLKRWTSMHLKHTQKSMVCTEQVSISSHSESDSSDCLSCSQHPLVQGQQLRKRLCYSGHSPHVPRTSRHASRPLRSSEAKHKDRQNSHQGQGSLEAARTTCFGNWFLMLKLPPRFAVNYKEKASPRTGCYEKRTVREQEFFEV